MTQTRTLRSLLLALALSAGTGLGLLAAGSATAAPITPQIFDSTKKSCVAPIAQQERLYGIPNQLLAAVSLAESGRWDKENAASFAWPWTVTAEGKGQFLASKAEAIAQVQALRARGIRNIDVGCMQINLLHHPDAFPDLETAFDPQSNVAYAASFLKGLFDDSRSWITAVGNYHSATPVFHFQYRAKVVGLWNDTRRRSAEEKRQETVAAYQERRAAQLVSRGLDPAPAYAANVTTPRPALNMAARRAIPMPASATAPIANGRPVPVGQVLPRSTAVPMVLR
ncbi:MAG TPA: transglycosylase SLT domain-containing protein [Alphaproteobacteria bacterium]|jgi:hypothetical protein